MRKARHRDVSFTISVGDAAIIANIVERANAKGYIGGKTSWFSLMMDLTACHANGNPLDLARLLQADDFNFAHDVLGIRRHIDRTTGKLLNRFRPRFSRKEAA